jgi:hypothetical protein
LVERGLRRVVAKSGRSGPFKLRRASFNGKGGGAKRSLARCRGTFRRACAAQIAQSCADRRSWSAILSPLGPGGIGIVLGEGGGDEGPDDPAPLLAGVGQARCA